MNLLPLLLLGMSVGAGPEPQTNMPKVEITFSKSVTEKPFTGRVFVIASKSAIKGPPPSQNWFTPFPFYAQDVKDWQPDTPLVFAPTVAFPKAWGELPKEKVHLQAILDRDMGGRDSLTAPGNGYSASVLLDPAKPPTEPIRFVIDQTTVARKFIEKERVKLLEIDSKLLSDFHGKPMKMRAGVVLPKSFATEPERKYPVVYEITGFGGDHFAAFGAEARKATDVADEEMIHVVLDADCRTGHHVFADSANNGPVGKALVEELIPHLEKQYRGIGAPTARFVTGHSSGGWSSLWLQVAYPDFFGGVWSTAPDPVDFHDFQQIDLYQPKANMFFDAKGDKRPIARRAGKAALYYKAFSDMEVVMGRGGQLFSFEAVFSPKGSDGQPMPLWNRATGDVDPKVAETWQRYDIRMILEKNWPTLGPKLSGKLHVYMGGEDTFYLEGATRRLQESLKKRGSDATVEIVPGKDHGNLIDAALRTRMNREMAATFRKHHPKE
jgi:hypothetical protein